MHGKSCTTESCPNFSFKSFNLSDFVFNVAYTPCSDPPF